MIALPFLKSGFRGERAYLVAYDVAHPKRWRRVFKTMNGYGAWIQLSVFQCRLTAERRQHLEADLSKLIDPKADHILIIDLGPAETAETRLSSLGAPIALIERAPIVV